MVHFKRGADGHLLKNAAGHLVKSCELPYGNCNYCSSGTTPPAYEITFSGVLVNTNCIAVGSGCSGYVSSAPSGYNITFTLPQVDDCVWRYVGSGNAQIKMYPLTNDCSGSLNTYDLDELFVQYQRWTATTSKIQLSWEQSGDGSLRLWDPDPLTVPSQDCGSQVFSNPHQVSGDTHGFVCYALNAGYGGTATVVPLI